MEEDMATFIFLGNLTDAGFKGIKDAPQRRSADEQLVSDLGGSIKANWLTMGMYDRIMVVDFPNSEAAAKFAFATCSTGNLRTTTLRGFEADEAMAIIEATP